jgi:hypothetical protein
MRRSSGLVIPLALLALGACGDNITTGQVDAPGPTIDSPGPGPDAMVDAMTAQPAMRAMTLAVNDVSVVDPEAMAAPLNGIRGGQITITFSDLTMNGGVTVGAGMSPIGGCQVVEFSPANPPNPLVDAGAVTITNEPASETPATGLLKTVGPCTFQAAAGNQYLCVSHNAAMNVTAANPATHSIAYTFPAGTFMGTNLVGSSLRINGFTAMQYNSGASAFPIIQQPAPNVLVVARLGTTGVAPEADVAAMYTVLNGVSPVPVAGATANFLGAGSIRIAKPADPDWGALDNVIGLVGEGFALDGVSADPADIPTTAPAAAIEFGCDNDTPAAGDDTCGDTGTSNALTAVIISGRATQKSIAGLAAFQMPTEVPGTDTWREWQCAGLLSKRMTLTADALDHILGNEPASTFAPTRIEVRVLYVAGAQLNGPNPGDAMQGRILAGHGVVGHTDP